MTRSPTAPPARLLLAVDALDVAEGDRILEVGGGRGVAAGLIAGRLSSGELVGIDRSEKAVAAAVARNAAHVTAGRARFLSCALEEVDLSIGTFDKVLAVNVNHFWVRPGSRRRSRRIWRRRVCRRRRRGTPPIAGPSWWCARARRLGGRPPLWEPPS